MDLINAAEAATEQEAIPEFLTKPLVDLFQSASLAIPDGDGFAELQYRLYAPDVKPGESYPLILFLNGHGPAQLDYPNIGQLLYLEPLIFRAPILRADYPFFVLAPKCPKADDGRWLPWFAREHDDESNSGPPPVDPLDAIDRVLARVIAEYPVDAGRISVFGISSGGSATWEIAKRYPARFAAIVPTASFPQTGQSARLEKLKSISVWAFHATGDKPGAAREAIAELRAMGVDCQLTEIPAETHCGWEEAFRDYDLLPWMLAQRQGAELSEDSAMWSTSIRWQLTKNKYFNPDKWARSWSDLWPRVVPISALAVIYLACRWHVRRDRRSRTSSTASGNAVS